MKSVELPSMVNPARIGTKALSGLAGLMAITFVVIAVLPYRAMFGSEEGRIRLHVPRREFPINAS